MSSGKRPSPRALAPMLWAGKLKALVERLASNDDQSEASAEEVEERLLRAILAAKRRDLRKRHGARSSDRIQRRVADKHARDHSRKLRRSSLGRRIPLDRRLLLARRIDSPLLDAIHPARPSSWRSMLHRHRNKGPHHLDIRDFDLLDNPIQTLEVIRQISEVECNEIEACLNFIDDYCLDAGAYLVLAEFWHQLAPVFGRGRMSRRIQKVISATGIDQDIAIHLGGVRDHNDVWAFPIRRRRPKFSTRDPRAQLAPQDAEKVTDQFCEKINDWLLVASEAEDEEFIWQLTDEGKANIGRMFGELLDNAERHSQPGSKDGDWSVMGYMVRREDGAGYRLLCSLAFLSVGQSMSDSLGQAAPAVRDYVQSYVDSHKGCGLSPDTLATVVALQDRITGDPRATEAGRGGTGLQDVIDFVDILASAEPGAPPPRVTILSGRSCIRLREPIFQGLRTENGHRLQWCNKANSGHEPPDPAVAFDLPVHFAGTLVSIAFSLDVRFLKEGGHARDDRSN